LATKMLASTVQISNTHRLQPPHTAPPDHHSKLRRDVDTHEDPGAEKTQPPAPNPHPPRPPAPGHAWNRNPDTRTGLEPGGSVSGEGKRPRARLFPQDPTVCDPLPRRSAATTPARPRRPRRRRTPPKRDRPRPAKGPQQSVMFHP
jgi:hypothetical protein